MRMPCFKFCIFTSLLIFSQSFPLWGDWCSSPDSKGKMIPNKSLLIFDHQSGAIVCPRPAMLEVGDGDVFEIRFTRTDPSQFNYLLSGVTSSSIESTSFSSGTGSATVAHLTTNSVTWRHDRHFPLYQVKVELRQSTNGSTPPEEAAPAAEEVELFSYTFPVWVRTSGWNLSFTSGFAFSNLTSEKFFIKADDTSGKKTVERDSRSRDSFRPDIMALVNLRTPVGWKILGDRAGLAFGLGLGDESEPRYYFGPSWTLGKSFILTGGWIGGKVDALPSGQSLGQPPVGGDNTLSSLGKRFKSSFFLGISFGFTNKEQEFLSALSPAQKVQDQRKGSDSGNE